MSDMAEPASQLISRGLSGYSEARDARLSTNPDAARALLDEAAAILQDEVAYVPLYVEPLLWAARDTIDLVQRPDNFVLLR
jgi:peptide/nickel transport system substrate-binding protein